MSESIFCSVATNRLASLIKGSKRRVLLALPAIRSEVAEALTEAAGRLGPKNVRLVLDCDEEVFRLGYGDIAAVKRVQEAGVDVRHCPGLRVGLTVVDDRAWAFTPTALYVQTEVHSDETPNAVEIHGPVVEPLARAIFPEAAAPDPDRPDGEPVEPEIGQSKLDTRTLTKVEKALEVAPPVPFDVARQVRVFQPYIQYVEMSLRGCAIQRRRVTIPKSIQGFGASKDIETRLRTTFELIEKSSTLSSKPLEEALSKLRDDFTRSLGKPWGRVVLRSVRKRFDERLDEFRQKLDEHKKKVEAELEQKLKDSRGLVIGYYLPLVKAKPPDNLLGQVTTVDVQDDQVRGWLDQELDREFPKADELLTEMKLDVQFRDVTWETLNEPGFSKALKKEYPHVDWDKPFDEFNAAKEREMRAKHSVQPDSKS